MRRTIIIVLAILFGLSSLIVLAESQKRTETIMLEGMDEEIETTRIESDRGYAIWLDTSMFELLPEGEGAGYDQYAPIGAGYGSPVRLCIHGWSAPDYTVDDALRDTMTTLAENGYQTYEFELAEGFLESYEVRGAYGIKDDELHVVYYLIGTENGIYYASIEYPMEAAEGSAARLMRAMASFEAVPMDEE